MRTKKEINKKLDEISELWGPDRTTDAWIAGVCDALEWALYVDIPYSKLYPKDGGKQIICWECHYCKERFDLNIDCVLHMRIHFEKAK